MGNGFFVQCCNCRRVKQSDGTYRDQRLPGDARVSHGICRDCYEAEYGPDDLNDVFQTPAERTVYADHRPFGTRRM